MSWLSSIPLIGGLFETVANRISPDKSKILEAQARINEAEVAGAPVSHLRLWRSFLGWVLALVLAWEVIGRPVVMTYWPETVLPPSMIGEIRHILLAMLGLGI
ncbi:MAG: hypothetical protein FWG04_04725 [Desulfovibrionaceae bacterium]|nr:hypothetical protein [Desulfovibrionaceae bacterium]